MVAGCCSGGVSCLHGYPVSDGGERSVPVVGTVANMRPEKGLTYFVGAAALVREKFPDSRFVVWGDGILKDSLEQEILTSGLSNVVELRGRTSRPEDALRGLDIFVLPSLSEASSNSVLEAMATGLPVVATRVGGNPMLIEDGVTGFLVEPGNARALSDRILQLIGNRAQASSMGKAGRKVIEKEFSLSRMIARYSDFYSELIG